MLAIVLTQRIGIQVFTVTSEAGRGVFLISPLVGEVYLGVDEGFGRPLTLLSKLAGKPLVFSWETFTGYEHGF